MDAGAGRRRRGQSVHGRIHRHPDEPRRTAARAGLERIALHAAGMAMPPARRDVHFARPVAGAHLEGSGPGLARDRGVSRGMATVDRQSLLHGWTSASFEIFSAHVGRVFDCGVHGRSVEDHHHASERRLLSAQRCSFQRGRHADAILAASRRHSHLDHHRHRSFVSYRADDPRERVSLYSGAAHSAVSVHGDRGSGSPGGRGASLFAREESVPDGVGAKVWRPAGSGRRRRGRNASGNGKENFEGSQCGS